MFVLVTVLIVLVSPVDLRSRGRKEEKSELTASATVFFGLFTVRFGYWEEQFRGELLVLSRRLTDLGALTGSGKAKKEKKQKAKRKKTPHQKPSMKPFLNRDVLEEGAIALRRVLKTMRPHLFEADLKVGLDDPSLTGQLAAFYYSGYRWFVGHGIRMEPVFTGPLFRGSYRLEVRLVPARYLVIAARLFFSKPVRQAWRQRRLLKRGIKL